MDKYHQIPQQNRISMKKIKHYNNKKFQRTWIPQTVVSKFKGTTTKDRNRNYSNKSYRGHVWIIKFGR